MRTTIAREFTNHIYHGAWKFLLLCAISLTILKLPLRPRFLDVEVAPKVLLVGTAWEQTSANRYCVAYAAMVANFSGRVLVVPSYKDGRLVNPDASQPDFFDFWKPPTHFLQNLPFMRMQHFLLKFRWNLTEATERGQVYTPGKILVSPREFARRLDRTSTLAFLDFLSGGADCTKIQEQTFQGIEVAAAALAHPVDETVNFAKSFLEDLGNDALVVHWRSMTETFRKIIQNEIANEPPLVNYHTECVKSLWRKVEAVKNKSNEQNVSANRSRVIVFSDVHHAYTEFNMYYHNHRDLWADRETASKFLDDVGAINGDDLLSQRLASHPMSNTTAGQELSSDAVTKSIVITEVLVRANRLLTCSSPKCGNCARWHSLFTRRIVRLRRNTKGGRRETWETWDP